MSLSLIALAAAAVASHSVTVDHHGATLKANYTARTHIETKTVGARTPNRMDMQRCEWTVRVMVDRALDHGPALARTIAGDRRLSGSNAGACASQRGLHDRIVAKYQDDIQSQLLAVAQRDQAPLIAELDSVRALASN